jgi:histidinol-phosphatase
VSWIDLAAAARAAEAAADEARREILPRFRSVRAESKADGSPVTEADLAAERAIRSVLREAFPGLAIRGEEYGEEGGREGPFWLVDPLDGTLGFARGIPLFATLIALLVDEEPVLGLIDCPTVGERYVGWKGGGCRRNDVPTRVSQETDLSKAVISHGDLRCFELFGERATFERMAREIPKLRGYTDGFGHAQVLGGGVGAMVDLDLSPWDAAPAQILVPEAGGRCVSLPRRRGKLGLILGSPALVEQLEDFFEQR